MNKKQKKFADIFIEIGNQTEAAKRAGYSEKTAYSIGNRLLKNVEVSQYIEKRLREEEKKQIATADETMIFLTKMMKGEIRDAFDLDPSNTDRIAVAKEIMKRYNAVRENNDETLAKLDDVLEQMGGVI